MLRALTQRNRLMLSRPLSPGDQLQLPTPLPCDPKMSQSNRLSLHLEALASRLQKKKSPNYGNSTKNKNKKRLPV
jgi:hypothetical protein